MAQRKMWALAALVGAVAAIGYFRLVPVGAGLLPFLLASVDEGHRLPGKGYKVSYNDAGAEHSGFHYTWVVADRWLYRVVVVDGYSLPGVRQGDEPLPLRELGGRMEIGFARGRHDPEMRWVALP